MTNAESMVLEGMYSSKPAGDDATSINKLHEAVQLYHQAITYLTVSKADHTCDVKTVNLLHFHSVIATWLTLSFV